MQRSRPAPLRVSDYELMKIDTCVPPDSSRPHSPTRRTHDPEQLSRDQRACPLALTIASAGSDHIVAAGAFVRGDFAAVAV
jgi:hypothetical protein